jgi:hypothetical protein
MNDCDLDELDEQIEIATTAIQCYEGEDYEFLANIEEKIARLIRIRDVVDQGAES